MTDPITINAQLLRTIDEMQDEIDRLKGEILQLNRNIQDNQAQYMCDMRDSAREYRSEIEEARMYSVRGDY